MENMTTPAAGAEGVGLYYPDEVDKMYRFMSMVILIMVCVLGMSGNGVVIWVTGFRMEKTVNTVWYLNLAVADFLLTGFLPLTITQKALYDSWPFGWFMCRMDGLVFHMNMYASIYTLVVISVDRCVGVVWPLWARCSGHRTVRKASWVSLGVWVVALAPSIPYAIFIDYYDEYCVSVPDPRLTITTFVMGFLVPFSIIVSCYSVIIYQIRNNRSLASRSGRSFRIIAAVIIVFFLCWIPYHILLLIYVCMDYGLIKNSETLYLVLWFGYPISITLALVNSCVNPLLYVFSQGFKDVFRCRSILKVLEKAFTEEPPQSNDTLTTDPDVTEEPPQSNDTLTTDPDVTEEPPQTSNTLTTDPDVTEEPPQTSNTLTTDPDVTEEPPQTNNTPTTDPDVTEEPPQTSNTLTTDPDVSRSDVVLSEIEGSTGPPETRDPPGDCPV